MNRLSAAASLVTLALITAPSFAQSKKPTVGTLGTAQMPGGDAVFGKTYTVGLNGGLYNITITSAEYAVGRHNVSNGVVVIPKPDEKLLILHLTIKNPLPNDEYISGNTLTFSTVGFDDITRDQQYDLRLASAKSGLADTLKPGQKFPEDVLAVCLVPAAGPVPKLILNMGRQGTNDRVTRFFLGKGPNKVKPLPAPFADPADPTGATARADAPAKIGVTYPAGHYDLQVTSIAYMPGPIGNTSAGDNNQLLVATVAVTNKVWSSLYTNEFLKAQLTTDDDEKTDMFTLLKGKRDEPYEGRNLDPNDTMIVRLVFAIPKNAKGTKLKLAEVVDNTNVLSHGPIYDISASK